MANAMRKIGVYLGLVEDDPLMHGYDDAGYSEAPARAADPTARLERVTPMREEYGGGVAVAAPAAVDPYSIHTIHPRNYNDARRIGEEYRTGSPVIINLTEMDDADAKRIVDFSAGLVFGLHGTIERVTNKVFLLSPKNVDVRDAPAVQQARDGFFNQS